MRYVGNSALSPQIQERIQNTFRQTLGLAEEGNRQEALLGCDFILRLDPLFEPARRLQERLNDGDGPVDTLGLVDSADTEPQTSETVSQPETQVEPPPLEPEEAPIPEGSVDIGELIADGPDEPPLVNDEPVPATPIELTTEDDPAIATTPADEMSLEVEPPVEAVELTTEAEPTIAATPAGHQTD